MKPLGKLLLIEDNKDVSINTAELLTIAGYEMITAENGKIGVQMAIEQLPDLTICDIMMPELDGFEVFHILSKNPRTASIPFIFLTAKSDKSEIRKGMLLGADDYLTKPFDEADLLSTIAVRLKKNAMRKRYENNPEGLSLFLEDARKTLLAPDIATHNEEKIYKKKSIIFLESSRPNAVYFLQHGTVKTVRAHPDGKALITNLYKENDFFGYEAILEDRVHTDTAIAMEECHIISISNKDFLSIFYARPAISMAFISLLCKKVAGKEERLLHLAYNSVRQRTAEALLNIWHGNVSEAMTISRDDLAKVVGTAPESVVRVLSDFREEKLVDIDTAKIRILKPEKLKKIIRWNAPPLS